ncbi:MAG: sugar-transfer associated ATP-grasp domain-containing protein [Rhodocyclaceae bacterium]
MARLAKLLDQGWWTGGMGGRLPMAWSVWRALHDAAVHYRTTPVALLTRYARLSARGFTLPEMKRWGLLDPALDTEQLDRHVSKRRFMAFQARCSPRGHAALLEDKEVFHRYATAIGMPLPELVGFLSGEVLRSGLPLDDGEQDAALHTRLTHFEGREVLIKPSNGVYGRGIECFSVRNGLLHQDRQSLSLAQLAARLPAGSRYIMQERLYNHPFITHLTGLQTLQTLRVVTALPRRPAHRARIVSAAWRSVVRNDLADNFNYGHNGTLRAQLDPDSGRILRVVRAHPSGFGMEDVEHHPVTGQRLTGEYLPDWACVSAMLSDRAALFHPIRLVGWDVALTAEGPRVLEGNFWFDPGDNACGGARIIEQRLPA